jgi:hypothetical protein
MKVRAKIVLLDESGRHERGDEFTVSKERGESWVKAGKAAEVKSDAAPSTKKAKRRPAAAKVGAPASPPVEAAPVAAPVEQAPS